MTTAIICSAILAALVFLLGANVTRMRVVTGKAGGSQLPQDPASTFPSSSCSSCWSAHGAQGGWRSR